MAKVSPKFVGCDGPVFLGRGVTVHPDIMGGQPCVEGQRFPVQQILSEARQGWSIDQIISEHPTLSKNDIFNALVWLATPKKQRKKSVNAALDLFLAESA